MKTDLECLPCLARNAVITAQRSTDDPAVRQQIVSESLHLLANADRRLPPPFYARAIMDIALKHCSGRQADLYQQEKENSTTLAKRLLNELKTIPEYHPESFESRLRLAIAGNILDFGIFSDLNLQDAVQTVREAFTRPIDLTAMRKLQDKIASSEKILYILDNCGEAVFDRVFMEPFLYKITLAVRGRNSLNDVTRKELESSGFDPSAIRIVDNGTGIPGVMEEFAGEEFRSALKNADLTIAKGQGNFETMNELKQPISFLFLAKCSVVIRELGAELKSIQIRNINF